MTHPASRFRPAIASTLVAFSALAPAAAADFALGADIGWLTQMESSGRTFRDSTGKAGDALDILKGCGVDAVRLRVWVHPSDGWCGKADVVRKAVRARAKGLRVMVDFHYSDSWADPGKQDKPAAWASYGQDQLAQAVAAHTTEILSALEDSGVAPEWIQIGNETTDGMLWPAANGAAGGRITVNGAGRFASLVSAGAKAARAAAPDARIVVHLANGQDNALFRWVFDSLKRYGADWDAVGMSLYPDPTNWRTYAAQCFANMKDMASRYGKQVLVAEVGMSWDQPDTSYALLKLLVSNTRAVPGGAGLGVFYWEPEAYGGWQGYTLGAFDGSGRPTKALKAFQEARPSPVAGTPAAARGWISTPRGVVWNGSVPVAYRIADLRGRILRAGIAAPGETLAAEGPVGVRLLLSGAGGCRFPNL